MPGCKRRAATYGNRLTATGLRQLSKLDQLNKRVFTIVESIDVLDRFNHFNQFNKSRGYIFQRSCLQLEHIMNIISCKDKEAHSRCALTPGHAEQKKALW